MIIIIGLFTSSTGEWKSTIVKYRIYNSLKQLRIEDIYLMFNYYVINKWGNSYYLRLFDFTVKDTVVVMFDLNYEGRTYMIVLTTYEIFSHNKIN